MQITLNGSPYTLGENITVAELVTQLAIDSKQVAVEKNREIVPKSTYGKTSIREGDEVEIVSFIGGG